MNTHAPEPRVTARSFLFEGADSADAMARSLNQQGLAGGFGAALRGLSRAGQQAAADQIAGVAGGLLDLDLGDILLAGWRKHAELTAAARRTAATSGSREVVELAAHRVRSVHQPYVDVLVDDVRVARVQFELSIEFLVQAVVGIVGDAHLLELRSGHLEVTVTLAAEGRRFLTRQGRLELPGVIRLGSGVPLLEPAAVPVVRRQPAWSHHLRD